MAIKTERIGPAPRIAVDYDGSGALVVFLHGVGGNRSNWTEQIGALSDRFTALAWDARGYGDSEDFEGPFDFGVVAADLVRVMDRLGAAKAHVVGLSMGGMLAQEFYRHHPGRVASLALCDTVASSTADLTPDQRAEFLRSRQAPLLAGKEPRDIAPNVARALASPQASAVVLDRLTASIAALHKGTYLKALEAVVNWEGIGDLGAISVPTLVIVGALDTLTTPAASAQIAKSIPGAKLHVIADAGHLSNIEKPAEFNAVLRTFLLDLGRSA